MGKGNKVVSMSVSNHSHDDQSSNYFFFRTEVSIIVLKKIQYWWYFISIICNLLQCTLALTVITSMGKSKGPKGNKKVARQAEAARSKGEDRTKKRELKKVIIATDRAPRN